ncbi:hypothetical protein [Trebonia sp.]|uniref:hypothetical protein n=1 Tax=Trebonia sp. TaxID=2767075 RepID=UPI003C9A4EF2
MTDTAAVTALRRYPVKSMLGEDLRTAALAEARFEGGPAVAVIERSAGNVATAERPRLWRGLLAFAGHWNQRSPRITLPDGTSIAADDPAAGEILSGLPGRDVHLSTVRPAGARVGRPAHDAASDDPATMDVREPERPRLHLQPSVLPWRRSIRRALRAASGRK